MSGKAKDAGKKFKVQLLETLAALMTAAFGLVAALAWNETIKKAIENVFQSDGTVTGLLVYAIVVTVIAVLATMLIAYALAKAKAEAKEEEEEE